MTSGWSSGFVGFPGGPGHTSRVGRSISTLRNDRDRFQRKLGASTIRARGAVRRYVGPSMTRS